MRDDHIDLCGQIDFTRTEAMPLLERDAHFSFACDGCGDCCRGREDIVLSGFDLWRIAARLRLPPQIVARGYCRASIGTVSHLPVLRLAPVKENRNNCPFLTERPLRHPRCRTAGVCAVPAGAGDQPGRAGELFSAAHRLRRAGDRSKGAGLPVPATMCPPGKRLDVRWAQTCMDAGRYGGTVWMRCSARCWCAVMQAKLWQALYFGYDYAQHRVLPQLESKPALVWMLNWAKLTAYQQKRNTCNQNN